MNHERITVLGICGRSGSGKGYVCEIFNQFGIPSIDTDSVYKSLVTAAEKAMFAKFLTS